MSYTLFNALQIFKPTMKLTIQPGSVEAERTFTACGLTATNPGLVYTTPRSMRLQSMKQENFTGRQSPE